MAVIPAYAVMKIRYSISRRYGISLIATVVMKYYYRAFLYLPKEGEPTEHH